jgi:hypothetical protein
MICEDVYIEYTDKHGKTFIAYHRVWDKVKFLAAKAMEALKEGGTAVQCLKPERSK